MMPVEKRNRSEIADGVSKDRRDATSAKKVRKQAVQEGLKAGLNAAQLAENWSQCCHLLKKKGRMCNLPRAPSSLFCGVHRPPGEALPPTKRNEKLLKAHGGEGAFERVPCPLDPSHNVYKHNLEAHLKICAVTAIQAAQEAEGIYCQNCNSGIPAAVEELDTLTVDANALADKVRSVFAQHVAPNIHLYGDNGETDVGLSALDPSDIALYGQVRRDIIGAQSAQDRTRHADQDTAILGVMARFGLTSRNGARDITDNIYVEFGAGKGFLGYSIQLYYHMLMNQLAVVNAGGSSSNSSPNSSDPSAGAGSCTDAANGMMRPKLLLVERSGCRRKADNKQSSVSNKYGEGYSNNCFRYRLDIRHAFLPTILTQMLKDDGSAVSSAPKKVIVVAKHLCGVATDMSVRSLGGLQQYNKEHSAVVNAVPYGVAIATCCHHVCNWDDYIGREWMESQGFTGAEFALLKSWSCWSCMPATANRGSKEASSVFIATEETTTSADTTTAAAVNEEDEEEEEGEHKAAPPVSTRPAGITRDQMRSLGREIKCLIDFGRYWYMKHVLKFSEVKYTQYCATSLTPECRVLLGKL